MADTLATLVRLSKHKVERAQEALAEAEAVRLDLVRRLEEVQLARREALASVVVADDAASRLDAGRYDARLKHTAEKLVGEIALCEQEIEVRREALRGLFAEQKRYEVLLEQERLKVAKRRAGKQQGVLDEVAGMRWRRE